MKSLTLVLIAAFISTAMVGTVSADDSSSKDLPVKVIYLKLSQAMSDPGLLAAMFEQIESPKFLDGSKLVYVATVTYKGITFKISGTLEEWTLFFKLKGTLAINNGLQVVNKGK
jgi:hypothetical protein